MKALTLTIALSIHGIFFTEEMTIAAKVMGLCVLLTIAAYYAGKKAFPDDTDEYK